MNHNTIRNYGENEDLDAYPRTFEADCKKLAAENNHAVFYPAVKEMYPNGLSEQSFVEVPDTQHTMIAEAAQRPGHFRGVSMAKMVSASRRIFSFFISKK